MSLSLLLEHCQEIITLRMISAMKKGEKRNSDAQSMMYYSLISNLTFYYLKIYTFMLRFKQGVNQKLTMTANTWMSKIKKDNLYHNKPKPHKRRTIKIPLFSLKGTEI